MVRHAKLKLYTGTDAPTETVSASSTTSYYSEPMAVMGCESFSIQVKWTNGANALGVFYVQVSNDERVLSAPTSAVWVTTAEVFPANPANDSSSTAETYSGNGYAFARLMFTNTSGTVTIGPVYGNAH